MTSKQVRSFKKRLGHQIDRIAKMVRRFPGLPQPRRNRVQKELARDLKREERMIIRIQKRCTRLARAA